MCKQIKKIIVDILNRHTPLLSLAAYSKSKFEGWLQLELASELHRKYKSVELEPELGKGQYADISFRINEEVYFIELKTVYTNWRLVGVGTKSRPITLNIFSIIKDANRLRESGKKGVVSFILFPVPFGNKEWLTYLNRISTASKLELTEKHNCDHVKIPLEKGNKCDFIVCCFDIS